MSMYLRRDHHDSQETQTSKTRMEPRRTLDEKRATRKNQSRIHLCSPDKLGSEKAATNWNRQLAGPGQAQ